MLGSGRGGLGQTRIRAVVVESVAKLEHSWLGWEGGGGGGVPTGFEPKRHVAKVTLVVLSQVRELREVVTARFGFQATRGSGPRPKEMGEGEGRL